MALKSQTAEVRNWAIRNQWVFAVVQAPTRGEALDAFMKDLGYETKPYLAESLDVHEASVEELRRYAALADAQHRSRTTEASVKNKTKSVHERLFGERKET